MNRSIKRMTALALSILMLLTVAPLRFHSSAAAPTAGDVNLDGRVGSDDARLALRASVKLERLSAENAVNADADRDGKVSAADARLILRRSVGLETLAAYDVGEMQSVLLKGDDRKPYESDEYELAYLASATIGGAKHVIFDDYVTLDVPTKEGTAEEDLLNMVGVIFNGDGEPFFILPDAAARAQGKFQFQTLHFSPIGAAELSDEKLLDLWAERAAAQSTVRRISEEDLTPGLAEMLTDCGLASNQYAGAVVRSILSLDTRGEILAAAIDGDGKTLRDKLVNFAGEYFLSKLFQQKEDKFLTQSLGDNAASVKQAVKDGKYKEALTEIVKNIEKNMFSYVNYADKIASLTDKLADIWTDDMMNEQYEVYKKLGGAGISDDDWNLVYVQLRGAAHRLSSRGVTAEDLRKKFEQRVKNEEKIAAAKKELLADAAEWREMGLLNTNYWYNSLGDYPSDVERLNSLRQIRETIRSLLTLDGKFQRGKGYLTDKDFLTDAMFEWVTNGVKGRANFYKWLRDHGIYLPREESDPPQNPNMLPFWATPVDSPGRQNYPFMEDVEQGLLEAGRQIFYKNGDNYGDKRTFTIKIPATQVDTGDGPATVTLELTGSYPYGPWDGHTGSAKITCVKEYDYVYSSGDSNHRRMEYTFTADRISVTDRGEGNIYITYYGSETESLYKEYKGEMVLDASYPITRNCAFSVAFRY